MLTAWFFQRVWLLQSLSCSAVQPPASQQEEQNQAQLQDKGQRGQNHNGSVNCSQEEEGDLELHTRSASALGNTSDHYCMLKLSWGKIRFGMIWDFKPQTDYIVL